VFGDPLPIKTRLHPIEVDPLGSFEGYHLGVVEFERIGVTLRCFLILPDKNIVESVTPETLALFLSVHHEERVSMSTTSDNETAHIHPLSTYFVNQFCSRRLRLSG